MSEFYERFLFVLWKWKGRRGGTAKDQDFARAVRREPSRVSAWKTKGTAAPPPDVVQAIATEAELDPGWLTHGEASAAPAPDGFIEWLLAFREHEEREGAAASAEPSRPRAKGKPLAEFHKELAKKKAAAKKGTKRA